MANYLPKRINLVGRRFGRLVVTRLSPRTKPRRTGYWECLCDCGNTTVVSSDNLKNGSVVSCKCKQKEDRIKQGRKTRVHGHSNKKGKNAYHSWLSMRQRCRHSRYYAGLGVKICKRWNRYKNFLADMGERPEGKTLDRYPNPYGDYKPSNCRWATYKEQRHNRRVLK